jgi:phosphoribosylformylglycinamidine synthase subunit PurQ / glutaminase
MTTRIKVIVLRSAGTNCDQETCHAFEIVGADAQAIHVNRVIQAPAILKDYQILAIPGGFSYGDDIAAGKILANQLIHHLQQELGEFIAAGKLVLGICNGFQVLVKAGILPGLQPSGQNPSASKIGQATITNNDSGKYEDRWVYLQPGKSKCVFIDPDRRLYLPVAHGEGKVCFADAEIFEQIKANGQIAFRYVDHNGNFGPFPVNPNGSVDHIAGLCDPTGRVLGLMPHPERNVHKTHHPRWTRFNGGSQVPQPDGLSLFVNAVNYFR